MNKLTSHYRVFLYNKKMEDNRHSQRQSITVKRDCAMDVIKFKELDRSDHHGHIVDISKSGVGIESNTPMEPGFVLFRDGIWGQHSGVLMWSKQVGTQFRSGIRFVPLPHDVALSVDNHAAQSGPREPLKDLEKIVKMMIEYIKEDKVSGREMFVPRSEKSPDSWSQNNKP
jgi:PilZ domain